MAYTQQQQQAHIRELQGYLHSLSHRENLPHIAIDGIYGVQTADAVREFQRQHQLRPNGQVNSATWNAIVNAYRAAFGVTLFPTGVAVYQLGARGSEVYLIQALLLAIQELLQDMPGVAVNGIYDDQTQAAVEHLQQYAALPVSGMVDPNTWNHLVGLSGVAYQIPD